MFDSITTNNLLDLMTAVTDVGDGLWLIHGTHGFRGFDDDFVGMTMRCALMFHESQTS